MINPLSTVYVSTSLTKAAWRVLQMCLEEPIIEPSQSQTILLSSNNYGKNMWTKNGKLSLTTFN